MSSGENISGESPPTRHFLFVPSFNPDRRHSWGNVISHISAANPNATNVDFIRWEFLFVVFNKIMRKKNSDEEEEKIEEKEK